MTEIAVREVRAGELDTLLDGLAVLLTEAVNNGAGVSFIQPLDIATASTFIRENVFPGVCNETIFLFVALDNDKVCGTVQLHTIQLPNQPHRCEVAKMMVSLEYRRKGIANRLMQALEDKALELGKTLVMLDTSTGGVAESLYEKLGFKRVGAVPYFAINPENTGYDSTTYMYKLIGELSGKG